MVFGKRFLVFMGMMVGGAIFISILAEPASALPTFARKYRTSCTTCHAGFFKLTPFGEVFRQNGYIVPGKRDEELVKEEPVKLGAPAWKRVFPKGVWPGDIPSNVPVAFYAHQRVIIESGKNPNYKFPHEFKLFTGGVADESFSFWGEYNVQAASLNRIFIRLNDALAGGPGLLGILPEDALNLRIGRLDVGTLAIPLNVRRTINKAVPYTYAVGAGADAWNFSDLQSGFEANGVVAHRVLYAAGVVNGRTAVGTPAGVEENNAAKDSYYRVAYKWGGLSFDGTELSATEDLKQTDNWVDNSITVGQFGYSGNTGAAAANTFQRLGLDARINFGNLDVYGAAITGRDSKPTGTATDIDTTAWFAQADYVILPWLQAAAGYERVDFSKGFKARSNDIFVSLVGWARPNVKFTAEAKADPETFSTPAQVLLDLTYAF